MGPDNYVGMQGVWEFELFDNFGRVVMQADGYVGDHVISKEEAYTLPYMKDVTPEDTYNE